MDEELVIGVIVDASGQAITSDVLHLDDPSGFVRCEWSQLGRSWTSECPTLLISEVRELAEAKGKRGNSVVVPAADCAPAADESSDDAPVLKRPADCASVLKKPAKKPHGTHRTSEVHRLHSSVYNRVRAQALKNGASSEQAKTEARAAAREATAAIKAS